MTETKTNKIIAQRNRIIAFLTALAVLVTVVGVFPTAIYAVGNINNETELRTAVSTTGSGNVVLNASITDITEQLTIERTLTLNLNGHTLTIDLPTATGNTSNGIRLASGVTLTIIDSVGGGVLNVTNRATTTGSNGNGAGINTQNGTLIIQSGTVNAQGGHRGAGIGGGHSGGAGTITIQGGTVNARGGNNFGAGIGGGSNGWGGNITISGGNVSATGGVGGSSGIGAGAGNGGDVTVTINGGNVTAIANSGGTASALGRADNNAQNSTVNITGLYNYWTNTGVNPPTLQTGFGEFENDDSLRYIRIEQVTSVPYLDHNGNTQTCDTFTLFTDQTTLTNGWYVMTDNVTIPQRITVSGNDVHLILGNHCDITINGGIRVSPGNSLAVYAQSTGANMGELTTTADVNHAGIGGNGGESAGTIVINGGTITAMGISQGAGIGGGGVTFLAPGSGGNITINGGNIKATGNGHGAGIGGGGSNSNGLAAGSGGTITITGGTINAIGGVNGGTGIGGGGTGQADFGGEGGNITITGGDITASGASTFAVAAIGGGRNSTYNGTISITGIYNYWINSGANTAPGTLTNTGEFAWNNAFRYIRLQHAILYIEADGTPQGQPINNIEVLSANRGEATLNTGWYLLRGDFSNNGRLTINGNVNLILEDGCDVAIAGGIRVEGSSSFTIWGQSAPSDGWTTTAPTVGTVGRLNAQAPNAAANDLPSHAGIGGNGSNGSNNNGNTAGTIIINGGAVFARGGGNSARSGAGIGGGGADLGRNGGDGGNITINSGYVNAASGTISTAASTGSGAGIGGGAGGIAATGRGGLGGTITITGGAVIATASNTPTSSTSDSATGAGIGGGGGASIASAGTINISGGIIVASGGNVNAASGTRKAGAGIGGGGGGVSIPGGGVGATVNITGDANITANRGIGTNGDGRPIGAGGGNITTNSGTFNVSGGVTLTLTMNADTSNPARNITNTTIIAGNDNVRNFEGVYNAAGRHTVDMVVGTLTADPSPGTVSTNITLSVDLFATRTTGLTNPTPTGRVEFVIRNSNNDIIATIPHTGLTVASPAADTTDFPHWRATAEWTPDASGTDFTITAAYVPGNNDRYVTGASETLTGYNVNKANQALLEVTGLTGPYAVGQTDITVGVTGGSGSGTVTFTSNNTDVATVDQSTGILAFVGTGTFTITAVKAGNAVYNETQATSETITVNRGIGATMNAPTVVGAPTANSITVSAAFNGTNPGSQTIEYGINTTNNADTSNWATNGADNGVFTELNEYTEYFFFARAKENTTHLQGAASSGTAIRTADITPPTGEINVRSNSFTGFLNTITFGLFFQNTVTVIITGADAHSGVNTVQYFRSETNYADIDAVNAAITATTETWITIANNGSFNIESNWKGYIYAQITDNAGNETLLRTDGVVRFTNSSQDTPSISHTVGTNNKTATVTLNGNRIAGISNGSTPLTGSHFSVSESGAGNQITLYAAYLDSLNPGRYTLTVSYNPVGEIFVSGGNNDAPATTSITLNIIHPITITDTDITYNGKTFDGNTDVIGTVTITAPNILGGHTVTVGFTRENSSFDNANAGSRTITFEGLSLGGQHAEFYSLTSTATEKTNVEISKATSGFDAATLSNFIIVSGNTNLKTYDLAEYLAPYVTNTNASAGTITYTLGDFNNQSTGTNNILTDKPILQADGKTIHFTGTGQTTGTATLEIIISSDNYTNITRTLTFEATAKTEVTIGGLSISDSTYNGNAHGGFTGNAAFTLLNGGGTVTPGNITLTVLYTGDANDGTTWNNSTPPVKAGSYTVTVSLNNDVNYIGSWSDMFDIERASLTVTPNALSKYYGMTDPTFTYTYSGYVSSERPGFSGALARTSGDTVNTYAININTLELTNGTGGFLAANYTLTLNTTTVNFTIAAYTPAVNAALNPNGENGWFILGNITLTAPTGYEISTSNVLSSNIWTASINLDNANVATKSTTYYLRNTTTGAITTQKTAEYKVDMSTPTISVSGDTATYKQSDSVIVTSGAGVSNVASVHVQIGSGDWIDITDTYSSGYTVTANGTYTFRVTNGAGVTATDSITYVNIDTTKPVVFINSGGYTSGTWTNANVTLSVSNTASYLGPTMFQYSTNGTDWNTYTEEITVSAEGTVTYSFRATSASGMVSDTETIQVRIDKTAPTVQVRYNTNNFRSFLNVVTFDLFFRETVDVTIQGADTNGSGVAKVEWHSTANEVSNPETITDWTGGSSFSVLAAEVFALYVKVTDNAGNFIIAHEGVVVFTNSLAVTTSISHTIGKGARPATVTLNGNTITKINDGIRALTSPADYSFAVENDTATITFTEAYLDGLTPSATPYTLTISYNPQGIAYPATPHADSDTQPTTTIALTVSPPVLSGTASIDGTNAIGQQLTAVTTSVTGGDGTFNFQWLTGDVNVGTNSPNYTIQGTDAGKTITVIITRANGSATDSVTATLGDVVPFNISINNVGNVDGDTPVTLSATNGRVGDIITLNYVLGSGGTANSALNFIGGTELVNLTAAGQSITQNYTVNASDANATTGTITITATFVHTDLQTRMLSFPDGNQQAAFSDANITKTATPSAGGGTITYESSNEAVSTVNSTTGEVTIVGVGSTNISAVIASDELFIETDAQYTLTVVKANNPNAPTGLGKTDASVFGTSDGTITGINNTMEWRAESSSTYTAVSGTTVTGLAAGTYHIRFAQTATHFASPDATVVIGQPGETFSFTRNAGTGGNVTGTASANYTAGTSISVTANADTGYHFVNWAVDGVTLTSNTANPAVLDMPTSAVTLTANFAINTYTVTFDSQSGSAVAPITGVTHGNTINAPDDPERTGWSFGGWYKEDTHTTAWSFTSDMVTMATTLYAKWIDNISPTGTITVRDKIFTTFFNTVTFGLFFKNTVDITISGTDSGSGVATVQYFLSALDLPETTNWNTISWETGTSFSITSNWKGYVYARITDNAGNATIIRSDRIVRYSDSTEVTTTISHTIGSGNKTATVTLNGNTIAGISNSATTLTPDTHYTVSANTITFLAAYLDSLSIGNHTLTVSYNPMGETFVTTTGNEAPTTTSIVLIVSATPVVPTITTTSLSGGTTGTAYSQTLVATGDTPITWSVDSGTLPAGLTLSNTGVISGTPTEAGTSNFTVKAANSAGNHIQALSITITAAAPPPSDNPFADSETPVVVQIGDGTATLKIESSDNAPFTVIRTPAEEIFNIVFTAAELERIANGENARIFLTVEDISNTVSNADKALVNSALGNYALGLYLGISKFKQIGNDDPTQIFVLGQKISISIEVPENLRAEGRTFKIIRIHNGKAEIINGVYDHPTGLFSFETDRFSTFALVYSDNTNSPPTGSETPQPPADKPTEPEQTKPKLTEPELTKPELTEPELTKPKLTEPESTESEPTAEINNNNKPVPTGASQIITTIAMTILSGLAIASMRKRAKQPSEK